MKSHYDTLGVESSATKENIKKAFRKLCMETHPDVSGNKAKGDNSWGSFTSSVSSKSSNTERFKQISEAYRVLSNDKKRKQYDFEFESRKYHFHRPHGTGDFHHGAGSRFRSGGGASSSWARFVEGIYSPRNLALGLTIGFVTVSVIKYQILPLLNNDSEVKNRLKIDGMTGKVKMVEAWKNPRTGNWEQPAPWDPIYRKLQPKLQKVPRSQVRPANAHND